jgi:hypothetical protein
MCFGITYRFEGALPMAAARPELTGRKVGDDRLVYTVPEAGARIGLSRNGSYNAAKRGDFPTVRVGARLLVPRIPFDRKFGLEPAESA